MRYSLEKFSAIPQAAREKLVSSGIQDSDALLQRAELPEMRALLAKQIGYPVSEVTKWTGMCDLVRVKGIGPAYAELLVVSGVASNIQQLISQFSDESKPSVISSKEKATVGVAPEEKAMRVHEVLLDYARQNKRVDRVPGLGELLNAVEEAKELRPRLILSPLPDKNAFRLEILSDSRRDRKIMNKFMVRLLAAILGLIAIAIAANAIYVAINLTKYYEWLPQDFRFQIVKTISFYSSSSLAISTLMVLLLACLVIIIQRIYSYIWSEYVEIWLFDHPSYWEFYRVVSKQNTNRQMRAGYIGIGIILVLVTVLTVLYLKSETQDGGLGNLLGQLYYPACLSGIIITGVIAYPSVKFYIREIRFSKAIEKSAFQRYLIDLLGQIVEIPLLIFFMTRLLLPGVQFLGSNIDYKFILPGFTRQVYGSCLAALPELATTFHWTSPLSEKAAPACTRWITYKWADNVKISQENVINDVQITMDWLTKGAILWIVVTAILLLFILPYLIIGGIYKGLAYILLLLAVAQAQGWLESNSLGWIGLNSESVGSEALVLFIVIACALTFDWLIGVLTERKKVCQECKLELDDGDLYCSGCGLMQP
jgi:hypothetical protein